MKLIPFLVVISLCTSAVAAAIYVEDFEHATDNFHWGLDERGKYWCSFTNPDGMFEHSIRCNSTMVRTPNFSIDDFDSISLPPEGNALMLWYGTDRITFRLQPDQSIASLSLDFLIFALNTPQLIKITVTGTEYSHSWIFNSQFPYQWRTIDTSGTDFGEITQLELRTDNHLIVDNIAIHVVPEPCTVFLFGIGGLLARKSYTCKNKKGPVSNGRSLQIHRAIAPAEATRQFLCALWFT